MEKILPIIITLVPGISLISAIIYVYSFYGFMSIWSRILRITDYFHIALYFVPFLFVISFVSGVVFVFLEQSIFKKNEKIYFSFLYRRSKIFSGTSFVFVAISIFSLFFMPIYFFLSVSVTLFSVIVAAKLGIFIYRVGFFINGLSKTFSIVFVQSVFIFVVTCLAMSSLAGSVSRHKLQTKRVHEGCELVACVGDMLIVDRVDVGFLAYKESRLFLTDTDGRIITSEVFEVRDNRPLACRLFEWCYGSYAS